MKSKAIRRVSISVRNSPRIQPTSTNPGLKSSSGSSFHYSRRRGTTRGISRIFYIILPLKHFLIYPTYPQSIWCLSSSTHPPPTLQNFSTFVPLHTPHIHLHPLHPLHFIHKVIHNPTPILTQNIEYNITNVKYNKFSPKISFSSYPLPIPLSPPNLPDLLPSLRLKQINSNPLVLSLLLYIKPLSKTLQNILKTTHNKHKHNYIFVKHHKTALNNLRKTQQYAQILSRIPFNYFSQKWYTVLVSFQSERRCPHAEYSAFYL